MEKENAARKEKLHAVFDAFFAKNPPTVLNVRVCSHGQRASGQSGQKF